jgi:paraquat-inducible protein B
VAEPQPASAEQYPQPKMTRRSRLGLSWIWIVPIVALLVGALLAVRAVLETGPTITIEFRNAEGIEAGRTELRYKEVVVGRVTRVNLSPDGEHVLVTAVLESSASRIAVEDSRFWVVRPRIGTAGISGLGTLLSGSYIGVDAGASGEAQRRFKGLETPPFVLRGEPGRSFVLSATDLGSLEVGSPVYYRRARVGRVVGYQLDAEHDTLAVRVFIEAPNERLVTQDSRFWNASGIDVDFDAGGFRASAQSIASVLAGGIAFANPDGQPLAAAAEEGQGFVLFDSRDEALAAPDGTPLRVRMVFEQSLRGLSPGAPLDLLGVEVGSVRSVAVQSEPGGRLVAEVTADIYPARLGNLRTQFVEAGVPEPKANALFVKRLVERGLRAKVQTGNLVTGLLYVALAFERKAPKVSVDDGALVMTIPSAPGGSLSDIQPQLAEIVGRLGKVRFDEIGNALQDTLKSANAASDQLRDTLKSADAASRGLQETLSSANTAIRQLSPEAQRALAEVRQTLAAAQLALAGLERNVARPDAPLQRNANQALLELQRAAHALRVLGDYLQQHPEALLRGKPADPALSGGAR